MIRQSNGIDTLYTLRTSSGSGDAVLTNEKLPRVASRGREVEIWRKKPCRGVGKKLSLGEFICSRMWANSWAMDSALVESRLRASGWRESMAKKRWAVAA